MDPITGLLALYAFKKSTGAGSTDVDLTAYALPTWGWLVVLLPWDMYTVIGNEVGFNTNNKGVFQLRFGTADAGTKAQTQFMQYLNLAGGLPSSTPIPKRETAFAHWYAGPRLISAKWRSSVWALDERDNIATVDKGHFLGKPLQGTQATCSALITNLLKQPGANLEPLQSSTVGRCHSRHG